jgi:hypothetical protein
MNSFGQETKRGSRTNIVKQMDETPKTHDYLIILLWHRLKLNTELCN